MGEPCVIENVCFVGSDKPVDIAVGNGRIASVRPSERPTDAVSKIWVIPGLWDCHTHFTQWSYTLGRLDLIDARSAGEALDMLRRHLEERRESGALDPNQYVVGMRFRHSLWSDDAQPTGRDRCGGGRPAGGAVKCRYALRLGELCRRAQAWRRCGRIRTRRRA